MSTAIDTTAIDTPLANQADRALERIVRHTLETMCFAEAQRLPSFPSIRQPLEARVDFSGRRAGNLQIAIEPAAARALTAAFLGVEPWHPSLESHIRDTVDEIARVVCGRIVTSLDPAAPFETTSAIACPGESGETIRQAFRLPAGTLAIVLQLA